MHRGLEERRPMAMTRSWMLPAGVPAAFVLLGWLCGAGWLLPSRSPCATCRGEGKQGTCETVRGILQGGLDLDDPVTVQAGGPACSATGGTPVNGPFLASLLPEVVIGAWEFLCVVLVAGLLWGLRTVDCRLCGGSGRLTLEASPPGESPYVSEADCVRCDGQGRLRALDRWTTRA